MKKIFNIPFVIIFMLAVWAWAALWWGDVLWTAHERSFFAFEPQLMQSVLCRPFGSLWVVGRAMLSLCAWPWLGGLLFAVLLTGTACCLRYVVITRRCDATSIPYAVRTLICYLPSVAWIFYLSMSSYNAYFKAESGRIFGVPALALLITAIWAVFVASFRRRRKGHKHMAVETDPQNANHKSHISYLIPYTALLLLILTIIYEKQYRPWTRPTAKMERYYADEDWNGIRETALANYNVSCRTMAAYYAIALVREDAIMKHLFDIRFEYDDTEMCDWTGELMNNAPYYVTECTLHAGLLQFAYHKAMEDLTMDGPTIHNLKLLTQVAVLRHEKPLANKYLAILDRALCTKDFTDKWRTYLDNPEKMEQDNTVKGIRLLEPVQDAFESGYTDPSFLGYNLVLTEGRSQQALLNSIAVCLYTKLVPPFLQRAQYLTAEGIMNNPIVADALAMQALKNPDILRALPQLKYNMQRYQGYVKTMQAAGATGGTEQRKAHAEELFEGGRCYYPYYYYFGNLKATRKDAAEKYGYGGSSSGVN